MKEDEIEKARKAVQIILAAMVGLLEMARDKIPLSENSVSNVVFSVLYGVTYLDRFLTGSTESRSVADIELVSRFLQDREDVDLALSDTMSTLTLSWDVLEVSGDAETKWKTL